MNKDRLALTIIIGILAADIVGAIGMQLSDKFFVKENGNVGIGTDNPVSMLHLLQGIGPRITLGNSQDTSYIQALPSSAGSDLEFGTTRATRMTISPSGNVGIGTTTPFSLLHLLQGSGPRISFGNSQDTSYIQAMPIPNQGSNLEFGTNRVTRVTINPSGNVGIGTDDPKKKLQVQSQIAVKSSDGDPNKWINLYSEGDRRAIIFDENDPTGLEFSTWSGLDGGNFQTRMTILQNGNVGIGTSPSYKLQVAGTAGKPGGGSWSDSSDARLKKNIKPLNGALEKIEMLKPVNYEWINPNEHQNGVRAGLIAQDVEKVFPEWVGEASPTGKDKNLLSPEENAKILTYPNDFNAYLIKAIQEQQVQIESQQKQIEELQKQIKSLKSN